MILQVSSKILDFRIWQHHKPICIFQANHRDHQWVRVKLPSQCSVIFLSSSCRVTLSLLLKVYKLALSEHFQDLRLFKTTTHVFIYRWFFWVNTFADSQNGIDSSRMASVLCSFNIKLVSTFQGLTLPPSVPNKSPQNNPSGHTQTTLSPTSPQIPPSACQSHELRAIILK